MRLATLLIRLCAAPRFCGKTFLLPAERSAAALPLPRRLKRSQSHATNFLPLSPENLPALIPANGRPPASPNPAGGFHPASPAKAKPKPRCRLAAYLPAL